MKKNITNFQQIFFAIIFFFTSITLSMAQTEDCELYIQPVISLENLGEQPFSQLPLTYMFDGKVIRIFQVETTLESKQPTTVTLPAIPITLGLHSLKIYAEGVNKSTLQMDWAYNNMPGNVDVTKLNNDDADTIASSKKNYDCDCAKAVNDTIAQLNLSIYQYNNDQGTENTLASIDGGSSWSTGNDTNPDDPCEGLTFSFSTIEMLAVNEPVIPDDAFLNPESGYENPILKKYKVIAYPNPFTDRIAIQYTLQETTQVSVSIFNSQGNLIATLLQQQLQNSGQHEVTFIPKHIPEGIYYFSMTVGTDKASGGIILIK